MAAASSVSPSPPPMPRSFGLSAILHVSVFAALLLWAWISQLKFDEPEHVFEVVAGPGNDYTAEVAAVEDLPTVELEIPEPQPRPQPVPVPQPQPQPVIQPAPQPAPQPKVIERKPEPKIEPAPEPAPAPQQVSWRDFQKQHGAPKPQPAPTPQPIRTKSIDVGRVLDVSPTQVSVGAGGTAMTAQEVDLSKRYIAQIIQRIRRSMEEAGVTELRDAGVQFSVSLDGVVSDVSITRSSGSSRFDQAVLRAFRSIGRIGQPPTKRAEVFRTVIRMSGA